MSSELENKKSYSKHIVKFFSHPIVIFSVPIIIALLIGFSPDRTFQIEATAKVAVTYAVGSIFYAVYTEKISSAKLRDECGILKEKVKGLQQDNEELKKHTER